MKMTVTNSHTRKMISAQRDEDDRNKQSHQKDGLSVMKMTVTNSHTRKIISAQRDEDDRNKQSHQEDDLSSA